MESMSEEETQGPNGARRGGQNILGQRQTSNFKRQDSTDAPSRTPSEEGDYFQSPKKSNTSSGTHRADKSSGGSSNNIVKRPAMTNRLSTSMSYTLGRMNEDPKTSDKISHVMAQLDEEGVDNLEQLITEFAKQRAKPRGQLTSMDYRNENPWYGRERSKPNFSLGEPLPHVGEDNNERTPRRDQVCASINRSS